MKGFDWNYKRIYRICRELELNLRIKPKKRMVREKPATLTVLVSINPPHYTQLNPRPPVRSILTEAAMRQNWAAQDLAGSDLGDARLNKRSVVLLDRLADKPTASIPTACNGWAQTQAAYRFLAQEGIGWEDILAPHFACTHERMQNQPVVLFLQDTTELDFNGQEIGGLGTLSYAAQRGMHLHPTYAVSPEREPLGVLDAWMWVRDATGKASRSLDAGVKESCRWVDGYQRLAEQASSLPATRLVYVADREGDFIELLAKASALGTPVDWLIRSCHNRLVAGAQDKLWSGGS